MSAAALRPRGSSSDTVGCPRARAELAALPGAWPLALLAPLRAPPLSARGWSAQWREEPRARERRAWQASERAVASDP